MAPTKALVFYVCWWCGQRVRLPLRCPCQLPEPVPRWTWVALVLLGLLAGGLGVACLALWTMTVLP